MGFGILRVLRINPVLLSWLKRATLDQLENPGCVWALTHRETDCSPPALLGSSCTASLAEMDVCKGEAT